MRGKIKLLLIPGQYGLSIKLEPLPDHVIGELDAFQEYDGGVRQLQFASFDKLAHAGRHLIWILCTSLCKCNGALPFVDSGWGQKLHSPLCAECLGGTDGKKKSRLPGNTSGQTRGRSASRDTDSRGPEVGAGHSDSRRRGLLLLQGVPLGERGCRAQRVVAVGAGRSGGGRAGHRRPVSPAPEGDTADRRVAEVHGGHGADGAALRRGRDGNDTFQGAQARIRRGGIHRRRPPVRLQEQARVRSRRPQKRYLPCSGAGLRRHAVHPQHRGGVRSRRRASAPGGDGQGPGRGHPLAGIQRAGLGTDLALRSDDPAVRQGGPGTARNQRSASLSTLRLARSAPDYHHQRERHARQAGGLRRDQVLRAVPDLLDAMPWPARSTKTRSGSGASRRASWTSAAAVRS